jgi:hypothetical protein
MPLPFNLKATTRAFPILLEMEERKYKTHLIVVDESKHWEGVRIAKVLMKHSVVSSQIQLGDRVLLRGSNGKTLDSYDKNFDEKYRFCREDDIEAVLPEHLDVDCVGSRR